MGNIEQVRSPIVTMLTLLQCDTTHSVIADRVAEQIGLIYDSKQIYNQEMAAFNWMCGDLAPEDLAEALKYLATSYSFQQAEDAFGGIREVQSGLVHGLTQQELKQAISLMQTGYFDFSKAVTLACTNASFDEILADLDPVKMRIAYCEQHNIQEDPQAIHTFLAHKAQDPELAAITYLCNFDNLEQTNWALSKR